ncbi:MAG: hypothetical protein LBQ11_01460 [Candidatus Nomurabacteria bacterium]|jgi:ABC-2 type transport system permease protein|nr:hypothetical protein [Candidatus Nomurabacteria bacterium]
MSWKKKMTGTWNLIKLIFRRDRVKLPIWIISTVGFLLYMIPLLRNTYAFAPETLETLYQQFGAVPAGLFLTGPMDMPDFSSLFTLETVLWWGMLIAFMNTLFVIRHTRQNEEMGAQELIMSGRVHRGAGLLATLLVALLMNIVMMLAIGTGMSLLYDSWSGSPWLYAAGFGGLGFAWAVIAAVLAQLFESTRSANATAAILVGIAFMLRGVGDFLGTVGANDIVQAAWPSWLSPFGWVQATRSLTFPDWWPLLMPLVFVIVTIPLAFFMLSKRDVGSGLLPSRAGHARASKFLRTPLGLTVYLQKNIFIGWLAGTLAMVGVIGALVPQMSKVYDSSEELRLMIESMGGRGELVSTFLSAMLMIAVLMILAFVIHALSRIRAEEGSGHTENLLATRLSRPKWLFSHLAVTLVGATIMLSASGLVMALAVNGLSEWSVNIWDYVLGALSYWPLVALLAGLYIALFGLLPRAAGLVLWIFYGFVVSMSWIGPLLRVDQWIMDLSPISHMASAPAETVKFAPLLVMIAIATVTVALGSVRWRQRNLVD